MEDKIYTFNDLKFIPHPGVPGGVKATIIFENGYSMIVSGDTGSTFYGDGINTFEVWASCDDASQVHFTKEQVTEYMRSIQMIRQYDDPFSI
jgi:hypothetical protein